MQNEHILKCRQLFLFGSKVQGCYPECDGGAGGALSWICISFLFKDNKSCNRLVRYIKYDLFFDKMAVFWIKDYLVWNDKFIFLPTTINWLIDWLIVSSGGLWEKPVDTLLKLLQ